MIHVTRNLITSGSTDLPYQKHRWRTTVWLFWIIPIYVSDGPVN